MKARNFKRENFYFLSIRCFHCMEYYYINDHLFTPQKMIDTSGNTVWQADWDSFGTLTVTINTVENNLRFPGQYYDSETGFYYNFHRYYMPEIGRYLREDEVKQYIFLDTNYSVELYLYANSIPTMLTDPEGLNICDFAPYVAGALWVYGGWGDGGSWDRYKCICNKCKYPPLLPDSSPKCDEYGNELYPTKFGSISLKCFCKCAGNSDWSRYVRGCLRCFKDSNVSVTISHAFCYALGMRRYDMPVRTIGKCLISCTHWFQW